MKHKILRHSTRVTLGLLVIVATAAGGVIANPLAASSATSSNPQTEAAASSLTSNLGILGKPITVADTLPASLQKALDAIPGAEPQAELAHRAATTAQGVGVYVVPATEGRVCLADADLSESFCADMSEVADGTASSSDACSPVTGKNVVEIAGILPDGAEDPSLVLSNGKRVPLTVTNNTYLAQFQRSSPLPTTVQWTSSSGPQSANTNLPPDAATIDCVPLPASEGRPAQ